MGKRQLRIKKSPDGLVEKRYMSQRNTEEQTLHYVVTSCVITAGFGLCCKIGGTTEQAKTNLPTSHIFYGRSKAWGIAKLLFTNCQILHFCACLRGDELNFQSLLFRI